MKRFTSVILSVLISVLFSLPIFAAEQEIKYDSSWKISVSSDLNNTLLRAFDGDENTFWHSHYTNEGSQITGYDKPPHIITVDFGKDMDISGWKYLRRSISFMGTIFTYNIYSSSDGTNFEKIYSGKFDYGENNSDISAKTASWGDKKMRAIKIEILTTQGGYGTAAEISFLSGTAAEPSQAPEMKSDNVGEKEDIKTVADKNVIDRSSWTVNVSSDIKSSANNMIDGKTDTYWHSHYTNEGSTITGHDEPPFDIEVNFGKETELSGIILNPREGSVTGRFLMADIYAKNDGDYVKIVENRVFANTPDLKVIDFVVNIKATAIKLHITSTVSGYGTLAEIYAIEQNTQYEDVSLDEAFQKISEKASVIIDSSKFNIIYDGTSWDVHTPDRAIDNVEKTMWQTNQVKEMPITFDIDLGIVHDEVTQITYVPRNTPDHHGLWRNYNIYTSEDGVNFTIVKENEEFPDTLDAKVIDFGTGIKARYFRFEINEAVSNRVSCTELYFYETKKSSDDAEERRIFEKKKYVLKIGNPEIATIVGDTKEITKIDAAPFIEDGSTLIPVRGLFELMGAEVLWDPSDQTVLIKGENHKFLLQIENKLVDIEDPDLGNFTMTLICPPKIADGRTYIPLRFISESLGYEVFWNAETSEITIY